ncbi:MAG: diguanylate cyclase [Firmicutes bacterium]|nr:diguanylate cyclase [[Eubacterium] siraeum]MCM1487952.1 diguanylate cyclase [Bacillota bacterium]
MKIRTMFIFALVFFSISSIIAYAIYSSGSLNTVAQQQFESLYSDVVGNESRSITEYTKEISNIASIVGADEALAKADLKTAAGKKEASDAAKAYINNETGICRIVVVNKEGEELVTVSGENETDFKLFDKASLDLMKNGEAFFSTTLNSSGRENGYELVSPYILGDRIVLTYFSKDSFEKISNAGLFPTNGRTVFMDSLGHVVDNNYIGMIEDISGRNGNDEYRAIKNAMNNTAEQNKTVSVKSGAERTLVYTVQSANSWYVASFAEANKAFVYSKKATSEVVTLVVVLAIFFAAFYTVMLILITKPLNNIEKTLVKIHKGDHDSRVSVKSKNEYGDIGDSFNTLLDNVVVSERRYRTIVEMSDDIVFEWNLKTNNVTFSNNFNKKFSFRASSDHFSDSFFLKGKVHPEDNERYRKDLERLQKGEDFKENTYRWKNVYGDYIWIAMKTASIKDNDGNIVKIIGVLSDVDRAKKGEMKLKQQASYDALTGVYNRETIENVIDNEIVKVGDGGDGFAILFVDIDDFKIYNDKYSHATGDQVLKFVTSSIQEIVDDFGFIGRYGGDEFIVCIRNCSTNIPENIAKDILAKLKAGFVCDTDDHLTVSVSIGVYPVNDGSKTVEEIISIADEAMYKIKKNGKSSFGIVSEEDLK